MKMLARITTLVSLLLATPVWADPSDADILVTECEGWGTWIVSKGDCPPPPDPPDTAKTGFIAFSDLIAGPATGNTDPYGGGVIVTTGGYYGASQGSSTIRICDALAVCRAPAHIYYWRYMDGELPGAPTDLYESHGLSEIAFSIPSGSEIGDGTVEITVNGQTDSFPFRIRDGNIYFVASSGSDSNPGTWSEPWATAQYAIDNAPIGSTIYILDVDSGWTTLTSVGGDISERGLYKASGSPNSNAANQIATIAYPGYQPTVYGRYAVEPYQQNAWVVSKLKVRSGNKRVAANGQPGSGLAGGGKTWGIKGSKDGRVVMNYIKDAEWSCSDRFHGAITLSGANQDYTSNAKILGNLIDGHGCYGSDKLHHTLYFSIRSETDLQAGAITVAWNYLRNNHAKNGIHVHDQNPDCGDYIGRNYITNNVVVNQAGAGITWQVSSGCIRNDLVTIANNLLINVGLAAAWDGINPESSDGADNNGITIWDGNAQNGTMDIYGNTIIGWNRDHLNSGSGCLGVRGGADYVTINWYGNACMAIYDESFIGIGYQSESKSDNIYDNGVPNGYWYVGDSYTLPDIIANSWEQPTYDEPATPVEASQPTNVNLTATNVTTDFLYTITGVQVAVDGASPLVEQVEDLGLGADLYRTVRNPTASSIGAIEGVAP